MAQQDDEVENSTPKPALSTDSQAFIGLKLRELYDDVVAEPVPDRLLELLGKLGEDDRKNGAK
ncbi:NepR family anti-sigma factor [Pelagibacterium lacus]|nr:NepR family anti-sigma factor [Pelagibacterium lacus]